MKNGLEDYYVIKNNKKLPVRLHHRLLRGGCCKGGGADPDRRKSGK